MLHGPSRARASGAIVASICLEYGPVFASRGIQPGYNPRAHYLPIPQKHALSKLIPGNYLWVRHALCMGFNDRFRTKGADNFCRLPALACSRYRSSLQHSADLNSEMPEPQEPTGRTYTVFHFRRRWPLGGHYGGFCPCRVVRCPLDRYNVSHTGRYIERKEQFSRCLFP